MKILVLTLALFTFSLNGMSQFNDTIFYKSGMEKIVSIKEFTEKQIYFSNINSKGDTVNSQITTSVVTRFVMYDEDGTLQYDSKIMGVNYQVIKDDLKYPEEVSVSKHQLSINPFFIPFLSANVKYTYRFGSKMQFGITSRVTYLAPLLYEYGYWGDLMIGAGLQLTPWYNSRMAFGLDFVPMVGFYTDGKDSPSLMLPASVGFDFYLSKTIGISADIGFGNIYDGSNYFGVRGHLGVLIQFKDKKTFQTNYR